MHGRFRATRKQWTAPRSLQHVTNAPEARHVIVRCVAPPTLRPPASSRNGERSRWVVRTPPRAELIPHDRLRGGSGRRIGRSSSHLLDTAIGGDTTSAVEREASRAVSRLEASKENEMPFATVRRLVAGFLIACIVLVGTPARAEPSASAPEDIQYLLDAIGRSGSSIATAAGIRLRTPDRTSPASIARWTRSDPWARFRTSSTGSAPGAA
jgi:hypothetical protein